MTANPSSMFTQGRWLNEPQDWRMEDRLLSVTTDAAGDFWRTTHYGFIRDSGHFLGFETGAGFTASLRVRAAYRRLYDQAGIMVRLDEGRWLKAGIEWSDGAALLGSVLTLGTSDWATGAFAGDAGDVWLRVTVAQGVLRLQASADGLRWPLVRLCPFPAAARYQVGPMCCSPEGAGLAVRFSDFTVGPPNRRDLHDLG